MRNAGRGACRIRGYLSVHFTLATATFEHPLPPQGGQYVTTASPRWVTIWPRRDAYVLIATYRCDLGNARNVASLTVSLPGSSTVRTLTLAPTGAGSLPYCPGQPGHTGADFEMSPIEATIAFTVRA